MSHSAMPHPAIEFRSVQKKYGSFTVVRQMDLRVEPGELVVLLGPSGCGKSTLLKMISGIEDPTQGEIYVDGKLVNYTLPRDRNVAMVFQNYALYPHMTVAQNITYPLTTRRKNKPVAHEIQDRLRRVVDIVEISDQLTKYPDTLSGGQRQRVALARAIIRDPSVFLMDEPLSNLDALLRDTMRQQLIDLHKRVGKATIYVTHDQLEAMTMADRIVVMNDGIIQQMGAPRAIFRQPVNLFVAGFVGNPQMNLIAGEISAKNRVRIGDIELITDIGTRPPGTPVTVGLRPTDGVLVFQDHNANHAVTGTLRAVEYTGADSIITIEIPGQITLRIRKPGEQDATLGSSIKVWFAPDNVHVFSASGQRL